MIHLLKYGRTRALAVPLGGFLRDALARDERFDAIVPVPLHWRREWDRGFNQSELLANVLARATGISVTNALRRIRSTAAQAGLSNTGRRKNVADAFHCHRPKSVQGKRILLIDDVMTTGSTATGCALALKRAGARRVAVLTVARADRRLAGRRRAAASLTVGRNVRNA